MHSPTHERPHALRYMARQPRLFAVGVLYEIGGGSVRVLIGAIIALLAMKQARSKHPAPHLRRDSLHICAGTRPTSAPGLAPRLRRDSLHICAGTRPTSVPGRAPHLPCTCRSAARARRRIGGRAVVPCSTRCARGSTCTRCFRAGSACRCLCRHARTPPAAPALALTHARSRTRAHARTHALTQALTHYARARSQARTCIAPQRQQSAATRHWRAEGLA